MHCPHCGNHFSDQPADAEVCTTDLSHQKKLHVTHIKCPSCNKAVVHLVVRQLVSNPVSPRRDRSFLQSREYLVWPRGNTKGVLLDGVPDHVANDFSEACAVLPHSLKASAALARRCLQLVIRDKYPDHKPEDLSKEIVKVLETDDLPSYIAQDIDAIRNLGNIAAHPIVSNTSGELLEVDEAEANWLLDVLQAVIEFYYIQPSKQADRRRKLNLKLEDAGKPPMK